jgi:phosphoribosylanthranilate isomerase
MTTIKICGITNIDDACIAVEAGADMLGLIFTPKSPRYVTTETAAFIVGAIRGAYGDRTPRFVGVFVDEPIDRVRGCLDAVGLDLAQLHGREPPAMVRHLAPRAFKAIRPSTRREAQAALERYRDTMPHDARVPELLVDAYHPIKLGGTGHTADPALAGWLARRVRLLLAGGLTPDNVRAAVEQIRPWGVDVSSGVEQRPGTKDPARVKAFIQSVRAADAAPSPPPCPRATACGTLDS